MSVQLFSGFVVKCDGCGTVRASAFQVVEQRDLDPTPFRAQLVTDGWALEARPRLRPGAGPSHLDYCPECKENPR